MRTSVINREVSFIHKVLIEKFLFIMILQTAFYVCEKCPQVLCFLLFHRMDELIVTAPTYSDPGNRSPELGRVFVMRNAAAPVSNVHDGFT